MVKTYGLTTTQLEVALCQLLKKTNVKEYHVIAADQMHDVHIENYPAAIIQNVEKIGHRGSHWICHYLLSAKEFDYFDSYGKEISEYPDVIPPPGKMVFANTDRVQGFMTAFCGHFCLFFIFMRAIGMPADVISQKMNVWTRKNEKMVAKFVRDNVNLKCLTLNKCHVNEQCCCCALESKIY